MTGGLQDGNQSSMLLTKCASCAADLGLTSGKKCGRCATRYCGPACQKKHWEEGGHDQLCKKIKRGGGAEQYHADMKCAEAVAVAVEACADDTKGQTCYICTQALHRRTSRPRSSRPPRTSYLRCIAQRHQPFLFFYRAGHGRPPPSVVSGTQGRSSVCCSGRISCPRLSRVGQRTRRSS